VGGVGGQSAFIHEAWHTPRPYLHHLPHTAHPPHPLPKYSLATKNEQWEVGGGIIAVFTHVDYKTSYY